MLTSSPCIFFLFKFSNFFINFISKFKGFFEQRERRFVQRNAEFREQRISKKNDMFCSVWVFWEFGLVEFKRNNWAGLGLSLWTIQGYPSAWETQPNPTHPTDPKACEWVRTSGRVEKHVLRKIDYSGGCQATQPAQPIQML